MGSHFRKVCKHGKHMGQCRCAAENKETRLAECPPEHAGWSEDEHPILYTGTVNSTAHPVKVSPIEWGPVQTAAPAKEKRPPLHVTYTGLADILEEEGHKIAKEVESPFSSSIFPGHREAISASLTVLGRIIRRLREVDNPPEKE